jgi:hypothetical protein
LSIEGGPEQSKDMGILEDDEEDQNPKLNSIFTYKPEKEHIQTTTKV